MTAKHNRRRLSSGRSYLIAAPALPGIPGYRVLSVEETDLGQEDMAELLIEAQRQAGAIARERLGDPQCYTLLMNGSRTRRRPWVHVHIIPANSVRAKRFALCCFILKHVLCRLFRGLWALRASRGLLSEVGRGRSRHGQGGGRRECR